MTALRGLGLVPEHGLKEDPTSTFEIYTRRTMIVLTDKLPALAGLASLHGRRLFNRHLADLWERTLFQPSSDGLF